MQYALVRECTRAGLQVSAEVYGLFTRDLRQAEWVRLEAYRNDRRREQQGIVPDLKVCLNPERICELKGICSDSTHTNYNGAEVTGVAKRELTIPVEVVRQAVKLDERVFGVVAPAVGPWQRRLLELGGVRPLAFGQYGEWGAGFEELVRDIAEVGQEEAADRYMLASREAAVGIQRRCIRQRITCAVLRAQADVLLGRMKYALPGWAQAEARREGQAEAHCAAQAQAEDSGGVRGGRWDGDDGGVGDGGGDDAGGGAPEAGAGEQPEPEPAPAP